MSDDLMEKVKRAEADRRKAGTAAESEGHALCRLHSGARLPAKPGALPCMGVLMPSFT